ncbi:MULTISPECIES: hypothetical protein [unclassified Streptomyces]|uniref:hypothetical protein n=1 Tax=unclassified Streptomyces TaxID=2593676 RepID=UPI002E7DD10E|nr:hypothetical protein [Streptomyces sp. JV190]
MSQIHWPKSSHPRAAREPSTGGRRAIDEMSAKRAAQPRATDDIRPFLAQA